MKVSTRAWTTLATVIPAAALLACGGGGGGGGGGGTAYHVDLRYQTSLTSAQKAAFEDAAARIEQIVTASPRSLQITWSTTARSYCGNPASQASGTETIEGLAIFVSVKTLGSGIIAQSGPCIIRDKSHLPAAAVLEFSSTYLGMLSDLDLHKTILHEMLHTLGFGTMWGPTTTGGFGWDLLSTPGGAGDAFLGPESLAAAKAGNGAPATWTSVPVEDCVTPPSAGASCGEGTQDSHWRWAVFHDASTYELMTGWIDKDQDQPLSQTSVASLRDIGYTVDPSKADPFTIPAAGSSLRALEEAPTRGFWIGDDVRKVPPLEVPED